MNNKLKQRLLNEETADETLAVVTDKFNENRFSLYDLITATSFYHAGKSEEQFPLDKDVLDWLKLPLKSIHPKLNRLDIDLEVNWWNKSHNLLFCSVSGKNYHGALVPNNIPIGKYAFGDNFIAKIEDVMPTEISGQKFINNLILETSMFRVPFVKLPPQLTLEEKYDLGKEDLIAPIFTGKTMQFIRSENLPSFNYREILRALSIQTQKISPNQPYKMQWLVNPSLELILLRYSRGFALITTANN